MILQEIPMKSLIMASASPCHMVPDSTIDCCLPDIEDDTFYSHVMGTGLGNHVQQMVTSSSDTGSECSETEDKVYISLSGSNGRKSLPRSPLTPLPSERLFSTENIDIRSWRERHPKNWRPQDIINWIYFVCSRRSDKFDRYNVSGESFNNLKGEQLCKMTREDFIALDQNYGADLYECFVQLLKKASFKAPSVIDICPMDDLSCSGSTRHPFPLSDNSTMWSSTVPKDEPDQEMDLSVCSSSFVTYDSGSNRLLDLDPLGPGTGIAVIGNNQYDYKSDDGFDDIPQCPGDNAFCGESSGYGSDGSSCTSPGIYNHPSPPPAHSHHTSPYSIPLTHPMHQHPQAPRPAHAPLSQETPYGSIYARSFPQLSTTTPVSTITPTRPPTKQRGRPKREGGVPGQRGRKQGQTTKGNHLWEFIRDTINDRRFNPDYIKWENKEQGIFRIVNSAEIAKMWGRTKNNTTMTYEKFSRAMRFCRTQEFFADLPKEGNYPKKLCFRFGAKATHWAQ